MNRPTHVPDPAWKQGNEEQPEPTESDLEMYVCEIIGGMSPGELLYYDTLTEPLMEAFREKATHLWRRDYGA